MNSLTTVKAGAYLHHLHILSPDPKRLADFYGDAIEMVVSRQDAQTWMCTGPGRCLLISEGPARLLKYGAFACRDLQGLQEIRARAEREGLQPESFETPFFTPDAFSIRDPDGNVIVFGFAEHGPVKGRGLKGPIQHLTLDTRNVTLMEKFYCDKLGFATSDRVLSGKGEVMTCFMRSNHEHHTLACFYKDVQGLDHHSYEAGDWNTIRDWCDRFAERQITLMWGPGRHGPGNNLFVFIEDPDRNWVEISAELEVIYDRPVKEWPHAERTLNLWGRAIMRAQG